MVLPGGRVGALCNEVGVEHIQVVQLVVLGRRRFHVGAEDHVVAGAALAAGGRVHRPVEVDLGDEVDRHVGQEVGPLRCNDGRRSSTAVRTHLSVWPNASEWAAFSLAFGFDSGFQVCMQQLKQLPIH